MTLNEYQQKAKETCLPTSSNIIYMGFNLSAEVGELLGKLGKGVRHDTIRFMNASHTGSNRNLITENDLTLDEMDEVKKEAGDVLWQLAGMCTVLGFNLDDVAQVNLKKLSSRKERGVIDGDGDNR